MLHFFLHYGVAATLAHAVYHLIVGEHRAELGTPVHHRLAQVGNAVVHQRFLLFHIAHLLPLLGGEVEFRALCKVLRAFCALLLEVFHEFGNGEGLATLAAVEVVKHLLESPLRPVVILRVAGAHFAVPVERETYLVELFAVALYVCLGGNGGVLPGLDGVLLSRQTVGVVAHRVQHIKSALALVARVDVGGYVAQGVTHMKSRPRGVREHVEHVEFLFRVVNLHMVCLFRSPRLLPLLFNLSEIVFHQLITYYNIGAKLVQAP